jgi:hypothetical protein
MADLAALRNELHDICRTGSVKDELVRIAAVVAEALRSVGSDPILIGGGAVQLHVAGEYTSGDIDFAGHADPAVLAAMGFRQQGKHWINDELDIFLEFPVSQIEPDENTVTVAVGNRRLRVLSVADLVIDRLRAFVYWRSEIDGVQAMLLIQMHLDQITAEVRTRLAGEDLDRVLVQFEQAAQNQERPDRAARRILKGIPR